MNTIEVSDEDVTILPCTADGTYCLIEWTAEAILIHTGLAKHTFPFKRCYLRNIWTELSVAHSGRLVRRAVLAVRNCSHWTYTLAPEAPAEMETALVRLALKLNKSGERFGQHSRLYRQSVGLPLDTCNEDLEQNLAQEFALKALTDPYLQALWGKQTSLLTRLQAFVRGNPLQDLLTCCMSPFRATLDEQSHRKSMFGDWVNWHQEPCCLRTVLVCRHGQEYCTDRLPDTLTAVGEAQMALTTHCLAAMTGNFRKVFGTLSSTGQSCSRSADVIQALIHRFSRASAKSYQHVRVVHSALDERFIPHSYEVFETNLLPADLQATIKQEIDRDGQELEDSKSLFSSLLRGQGALTATLKEDKNPADLTADMRIKMAGSSGSRQFAKFRLPVITGGPLKFAGVYLEHASATQPLAEEGTHHLIYCGHSNTLRFHVLQELGFPWNFWMHCMTPHGSLLPVGLTPNGQPCLIIADSACTFPHSPLAWTFSSLNYGQPPHEDGPLRDKFLQEKAVSLLQHQEYYEEEIAPGIRYNAPKVHNHAGAKRLILIRKGHNVTRDALDTGLSELGYLQIQNLAKYMAQLLSSNKLGASPTRWVVNGVTTQLTSGSNPSLNESILSFKKIFRDAYTIGVEDHPTGNVEDLYAENLFKHDSSTNQSDLIQFIFADDYQLLKYIGMCFGIEPSVLRHLYWPHAGFMTVFVTPTSWPYLPLFGTVSHLPPNLITYQPVCPGDDGGSQMLDESLFDHGFDNIVKLVGPGTMDFQEGDTDSLSNIAPITLVDKGRGQAPSPTVNLHDSLQDEQLLKTFESDITDVYEDDSPKPVGRGLLPAEDDEIPSERVDIEGLTADKLKYTPPSSRHNSVTSASRSVNSYLRDTHHNRKPSGSSQDADYHQHVDYRQHSDNRQHADNRRHSDNQQHAEYQHNSPLNTPNDTPGNLLGPHQSYSRQKSSPSSSSSSSAPVKNKQPKHKLFSSSMSSSSSSSWHRKKPAKLNHNPC